MPWRIGIDTGACIGSGMCAAVAPHLFAVDGAHARALRHEVEPDELVLDVADSCPALAITVTQGREVVGPRP